MLEWVVVLIDIFKYLEKDLNQGGKGEVVGQLSCIYDTITTKTFKIIKKNFIWFLELSEKNRFEKKSQVKEKYH